MPCKRCTELSFSKDMVAESKQTVAKQSQLIRILKGDLGKDVDVLYERARKAACEGVNGMSPSAANQLMKDLAERNVKQGILIEAYRNELDGFHFAREQSERTTIMASDEKNRQMAALQDEIKTLEVRVEEQKRKAVEANLKLAQATRMVEKMERDMCLDSLKGDGRLLLDKRLAIVAGLLTATINDFAELKKRFAEDSDVAAVAGLKKMLADLRTELKREKTEHASA
ncbi:hypothetical protein AAVH_30703, partial [Aphelenchoides avenae]